MAIPIELGINQIEINTNVLYRVTQTDRGISSVMKPLLQVIDGQAEILGSLVPVGNASHMATLQSSFTGIYAFDFLPTYIYVSSQDSPSVILDSLSVAPAQEIALNRSLFMFGNSESISLPNIEFETDFPLYRVDDDNGRAWSIRAIFKMTDRVHILKFVENMGADSIVLTLGAGLVEDNNPTGKIQLQYGEINDVLTFGSATTGFLVWNHWYQIVVTYNGGKTSNITEGVEAFRCYLTDLSGSGTSEEETTAIPTDNSNSTLDYAGGTDFKLLEIIPDTLLSNGISIAILDIWDSNLLIEDAISLANHSVVNPVIYHGSNDSSAFVGWAMSNVIGETAPHIDDYVYYLRNDNQVNPVDTYRLFMTNVDNSNFVIEPPPILPLTI
jgi:hypothetical protein